MNQSCVMALVKCGHGYNNVGATLAQLVDLTTRIQWKANWVSLVSYFTFLGTVVRPVAGVACRMSSRNTLRATQTSWMTKGVNWNVDGVSRLTNLSANSTLGMASQPQGFWKTHFCYYKKEQPGKKKINKMFLTIINLLLTTAQHL